MLEIDPQASHEKIWLITKNKKYYYDADAIKEPTTDSTNEGYKRGWKGNEERDYVSGKLNQLCKIEFLHTPYQIKML